MGMVVKFAKNVESSLINTISKSTKLFVFVLFNTMSLRILREAFNNKTQYLKGSDCIDSDFDALSAH